MVLPRKAGALMISQAPTVLVAGAGDIHLTGPLLSKVKPATARNNRRIE
jgi:hypothetical protein